MDKPKVKIHRWITAIAVLLSLISGGVLLSKWWKNQQADKQLKVLEQQLEQAEQKEKNQALQSYQNQQKQLPQVLILANNPTIHQFFNDFLQGFAYSFANKHNLTAYCLPLEFGGFYSEQNSENHRFRELGNASFDSASQQTVIRLNQCYLFNKLGYERYLATPNHYLNIDFNTLTETISHELAHYFQFIKYEKSSCESSGAKDASGNFFDPDLVKEHTQFTQQIKEMIINSAEYPTLKKYWKDT